MKNLDPTLKTSIEIILLFYLFCINNEDLTFMDMNYALVVSWSSKVGSLPPCWTLLTRVGLGNWDPT